MAMPPSPFLNALYLSGFVRRFLFVVIPIIFVVLWADAAVYARIYQRNGRPKARVYFWAVTALLILALLWMVFAFTSPWWSVGEIVGV